MPKSILSSTIIARMFALALFSFLFLMVGAGIARAGVDDYPPQWKNAVQDSLVDSWGLYNRECTSFCGWRLHSRNGYEIARAYGNADTWGTRARSEGYAVNMTPAIGAVAWWSSGHVAWVEAINGNNVTIEEYNEDFTGHYSERVVAVGSVTGYIHFKDVQATPDLYVSLSGNDASNGSSVAPFRTIKHAIDAASATQATTIHIAPGTYGEKNSCSGKHIHFVVNGTGAVRTGG